MRRIKMHIFLHMSIFEEIFYRGSVVSFHKTWTSVDVLYNLCPKLKLIGLMLFTFDETLVFAISYFSKIMDVVYEKNS